MVDISGYKKNPMLGNYKDGLIKINRTLGWTI